MKGDLCFVCGLTMIGAGLWQLNPPVAVIAVGVVLLSLGIVSALLEGPKTAATKRSKKRSKS